MSLYKKRIPLRLLPLRATIQRLNDVSREYDDIYTDIPCRVSRHKDQANRDVGFRSSEIESSVVFFNRRLADDVTDLQIRYEDRIVIGLEVYRVVKASDAASAEHHLECMVEHLKTMQTDP